MAGDLDKHAGEDEHDGGEDHPTLLEAEGHGQNTHACGDQFNPFKEIQFLIIKRTYDRVGKCYCGSDSHGGADRGEKTQKKD